MSSSPWKKVGIGAAVALIIIGIFYFQRASSKEPLSVAINPAFGEYISSYTAGIVNSGTTIRIVLAKNASDSSVTKLFTFSPSIPGEAVWLDGRTVEFRPEGRLTSGQVYQAQFSLGKVIEAIPADLRSFEYTFQVIPQNFEVSVVNLKPYVKTDLKRQQIEGNLNTADFAEAEKVEKMLSAQQEGKSLRLTWTHSPEGKQHNFIVEDVARKESASTVELKASGSPLGIEQSANEEVEVPALGDFKVTKAWVEQGSTQTVVIQFSDPLNEGQNLEGLVSLTELQDLDFEIKDNEIRVYPPVRQTGSRTLGIQPGVRNILNYRMSEEFTFDLAFEQLNPLVRFTGNGNILPGSDGMVLPFEAVNLKAVDVKITKIYESNVLQFLQVNNLDGNQEMRRVAKSLVKKKVSLENSGVTDLGKWNRFTIDLSSYINAEPGAIYQVSIDFKRSYASFACEDTEEPIEDLAIDDGGWDFEPDDSNWDYYEDYYYGEDYNWEDRDNPCTNSYYTNKVIRRNVIASDLGIIAKRGGGGNTVVIVNDLKTTSPISGVTVELYDFQQQVIGSGQTDSEGKVEITARQSPLALVAKSGNQRGYMRFYDGESLSLSNFDVGGERVSDGLKGFLYGERGVWRPGDSLYLSFVLEDKMKTIPAGHPVVFELQNPQGQVTNRLVRANSENGFYRFATATSSEAPTGNWLGRVKVGGTEFTQPIKIETVKPNRLKINLDFGVEKLTAANASISGDLQVNWLHGAPGKNLKAEFEVTLTKGQTKFPKYEEFIFDDPSRDFYAETQKVFEGQTDETGKAKVNVSLSVANPPPGALNAVFRGKAFEESGDFSVDRFSIPYYPYESFVGIRTPAGDQARGMLLTDTTHRVDVVTVDSEGKPTSRNGIELNLYELTWQWWWDASSNGNVNFMSGTDATPVATGVIKTVQGKGAWTFKVKYPAWGRYFVKAYDPVSGHSTGKIVYIDWPGWAGRARNESDGATMLSFAPDKGAYTVGEQANLVIPGSDGGRALISVENGSQVLNTFWLETKAGDNKFSFKIEPSMAPNVFVHVTLLQPHGQSKNNRPIRLYGVVPIMVENPATRLSPQIEMPDVLEPGKEVTIKVSEKGKKKMTYTLAMVDEGLLDLTRYKTPELWARFYAREALGVKTWDLYDQVMGAYGGKIERLLAIGGDSEAESKEDDSKANRFKPVVKFFGPITIDGETSEHTFVMPQYIGSVKTMVVAGYEGAYGSADKATPVRKPLMVLATLPRVLGPEEKVKLPVTLFSMEKSIKNVKVEVKVSGPVTLAEPSQNVVMNDTDLTVNFDLNVKSETGIAKIEVTASSGSYSSTDVIEIDVRNPNTPVTKVQSAMLEAGKTWSQAVPRDGVVGSNSAVLEVSSLPPINLGQRLRYLLQYPYGCIEQTTSSVFPQLYVDAIKDLTDAEKARIQKNVKAGIDRLKLFQRSDGGFAYWPGSPDADSWGTTYAGHFLVEAEKKGYFIPNDMIKKWKKYQKNQVTTWRKHHEQYSSELIQAYRLYTLANAGEPDLGSMNRLREQGGMSAQSAWMLASSYVKAGQPEAAKALVAKLPVIVKPYQEMAYSYGSETRDEAIILEALVLLEERTKAFELVKTISETLSNPNMWLSTQSTAWALKSVASFASKQPGGELKFSWTYDGKETNASTQLSIAQVDLNNETAKQNTVKVVNNSKGPVFIRVITQGTPARGNEQEASNNLDIGVSYMDMDGNVLDITRLEQGTQFIASVSVNNAGIRGAYRNLAINQVFPSGWEINNLRLDEAENRLNGDKPTYQDIRDDRVYTYFDLNPNQRKTFRVLLTATYAGTYYLPGVSCEAMYDRNIYARIKGREVEVIKPVTQ
jgi:alpha-2-macroglobulin